MYRVELGQYGYTAIMQIDGDAHYISIPQAESLQEADEMFVDAWNSDQVTEPVKNVSRNGTTYYRSSIIGESMEGDSSKLGKINQFQSRVRDVKSLANTNKHVGTKAKAALKDILANT